MRTIAASLSLVLGLGFGILCIAGMRHFARTGNGPFERIGAHTSI